MKEAENVGTSKKRKEELVDQVELLIFDLSYLVAERCIGFSSAYFKKNMNSAFQLDQAKSSPLLAQLTPMIEDLTSIEEENRRLEELLENA